MLRVRKAGESLRFTLPAPARQALSARESAAPIFASTPGSGFSDTIEFANDVMERFSTSLHDLAR